MSKKYLSQDEAREYVKRHAPDVSTRTEYIAWHKEHNPAFLPRWPHRVWKEFSWNDFLGTTNSFEKTVARNKQRAHKQYRNMWEAIRYAQGQAKLYKLSTRAEWLQFYEEYEVPDDIPKRPWQEYDEFPGIDVWLGADAVAHARTAVEGVVAIVGLHHVVGEAQNVVELRVWSGGLSAMKVALQGGDSVIGRLYKGYKWDESGMVCAGRAMERHGHARVRGYVVPNMNALLWDLMECLEVCQS